jgi:ribosomal biogenesis protein LAS1
MNAAFVIWEKLLRKLTEQKPNFFESLIRGLQTALDALSHTKPDSAPEQDAIYQWQWHLLSSKKWNDSQQRLWQTEDLPSELIEACFLDPNPNTQQVAQLLLNRRDDDFRRNWTALYNASFGVDLPKEIERRDKDDEDEAEDEDEEKDEEMGDAELESSLVLDSDSDAEHAGRGWKLLEGPWIPRAIGL